jgi:hypothetical protein
LSVVVLVFLVVSQLGQDLVGYPILPILGVDIYGSADYLVLYILGVDFFVQGLENIVASTAAGPVAYVGAGVGVRDAAGVGTRGGVTGAGVRVVAYDGRRLLNLRKDLRKRRLWDINH